MEVIFLDTSALMKLYCQEIGSSWLKSFVIGKHVVISELALLESATVIGKYYRKGDFNRTDAVSLFRKLCRQSANYEVIPISLTILQDAIVEVAMPTARLDPKLFVRALDAIHIASAKLARDAADSQSSPMAFTLVSADAQMIRVAQVEGFTLENPENHP